MKYRHLFLALTNHLKHKHYTIITGARQVGKTSLLRQIFQALKAKKEQTYLINLEDKAILQSLNEDPKSVFSRIGSIPKKIIEGQTKDRIYLLIDEIQYLDDPTNFLKLLYDEYEFNVKVVVTGSSAFYIDTKFKDSLAGRKRIFQLYPLSFYEFVVFKGFENINSEISLIMNRTDYISDDAQNIMTLLMEYLTYGGYPAIVLENDPKEKIELLNELKNAYLRRVMVESGVGKEQKFMMMTQLLANQIGNMVNKNELSNTLGLDNKTVERYIYILEKCFHIDMISPFHNNLRKELSKMKKVFFNDLGLRNAILGNFTFPLDRMDIGMLFENFVYNQLRLKHAHEDIKYWRTADGNEVDFVIEEQFGKGYALEVKWNTKPFNIKKYKKFIAAYPSFPLKCIDKENRNILTY